MRAPAATSPYRRPASHPVPWARSAPSVAAWGTAFSVTAPTAGCSAAGATTSGWFGTNGASSGDVVGATTGLVVDVVTDGDVAPVSGLVLGLELVVVDDVEVDEVVVDEVVVDEVDVVCVGFVVCDVVDEVDVVCVGFVVCDVVDEVDVVCVGFVVCDVVLDDVLLEVVLLVGGVVGGHWLASGSGVSFTVSAMRT